MQTNKYRRIKKQKRNKNHLRLRVLGVLIIIYLVLMLSLAGILPSFQSLFSQFHSSQTNFRKSSSGTSPVMDGKLSLSGLHSPCAILLKLSDGQVLAEKEADRQIYPASLTKIMTVLLAVEHFSDLDQTITLDADLFVPLYAMDASMAGFLPGETVRIRDLLYGALLPSGAECCVALAREISGSEDHFAKEMNLRAEELGMTGSHFTNATGLQDNSHYTTVRDISILLKNALKNDSFREVFTTDRYSVPPTDQHPDGFTFYSTLSQSLSSFQVGGGKILGGKTGFTDEAGLCLASLYSLDGQNYILVTAGAKGNHNTRPYHVEDALSVYGNLSS